MSDILCVTNRNLCKSGFLAQIEKIADAAPAGIILREKDLLEEDYKRLAVPVIKICKENGVRCILHSFVNTAIELHVKTIHLPLYILRALSEKEKAKFLTIGASCHSKEEAREAAALGCNYITAGHIFTTECKKGIPPRGLDFLHEICESVTIPVYAIGGIDSTNAESVRKAGASGFCIMSGLMRCSDPVQYIDRFGRGGK